jgi:hypothetical protein
MAVEKSLIAFLTGVLMVAGTVVLQPLLAQASPKGDCPPAPGREKMVERLTADLGLSQEEAKRFLQPGVSPRELGRAAMLAKASGKPLTEVLTMKTLSNSWQEVEQALGVTPEQLRALHQDMLAARLAADVPILKSTALALLQQRYAPPDIAMAGTLAQAAGKPVGEVLAMRKINNQWPDVAKDLGLSKEAFEAATDKLAEVMPPPYHARGPQPPGFMERPEAGPGL